MHRSHKKFDHSVNIIVCSFFRSRKCSLESARMNVFPLLIPSLDLSFRLISPLDQWERRLEPVRIFKNIIHNSSPSDVLLCLIRDSSLHISSSGSIRVCLLSSSPSSPLSLSHLLPTLEIDESEYTRVRHGGSILDEVKCPFHLP